MLLMIYLQTSSLLTCELYTFQCWKFDAANISKLRESLQRLSLTFNIVAISVTLTKVNYLHCQLPNYSLLYADRLYKLGGSVALYVNNKFNCNRIENIYHKNIGFFKVITVKSVIQNQKIRSFSCRYSALLCATV